MPNNKSHHFVPKFYLKYFSTDPDLATINLFNIRRGRIIKNASLRDQCAHDYFYGKDGKTESKLGTLEGAAAKTIEAIQVSRRLPRILGPDHFNLFIFTYTQYIRTTQAVDKMQDLASTMAKHLLSKQFPQDVLDKFSVRIKNGPAYFLEQGQRYFTLLLDLDSRLLVAAPGTEFLISDNPVVFYNQLMEFSELGSHSGATSRGLQIFFPLGPTLMLMLFDPSVYVVGDKRDRVYHLKEAADTLALNSLQFVSAQQNVYFATGRSDVFRAFEAGKPFRRSKLNQFATGPEVEQADGMVSQFIAFRGVDIKAGLVLTFVRLMKPAKGERPGKPP